MEAILTSEYRWLWTVALALALFFPVRQLIWVLSVRREQRKMGEVPDENVQQSLKSRAGITSALLCLVFAAIYGGIAFGGRL